MDKPISSHSTWEQQETDAIICPNQSLHQHPILLLSSHQQNNTMDDLYRQFNAPLGSIAEPSKFTSEAIAEMNYQ